MYLGADFKLFRIFVENFEETNSVLFHKCENIIIIINNTGRRELPFLCSYQTSEHVHDVVC